MYTISSLIIIFFALSTFCREEKMDHVLKGNLALPTSQEPGPLFCLGQNIVDKGDFQGYFLTDMIGSKNNNFVQVMPSILYGFSDNFSLYAGLPIGVHGKLNTIHPTSLDDALIQLEYAFYTKDTPTYANQITVVANVQIPTKISRLHRALPLNPPHFLLGLTANHMSCDWYFFGSSAIEFGKKNDGKNFGHIFYYQGGLGKNLYYVSNKRILTFVFELFGAYYKPSKHNSLSKHSSNIFYGGPCIWFSTPRLIFQTGIAFPFTQKLFRLAKTDYFLAAELGWKFNI